MLKIKKEVQKALEEKKAVVALESTIISHGLPYPQNKELALELEEIVRKKGVIPATIAVLDGKICVGLEKEEIELLAQSGRETLKLSAKDISYALTTKQPGATTVAATMRIAAMANIKFFATGGIGGVHRGVEESWDISADLWEFSRSPVMVISAGAKAILDLPKTLEFLETAGVLVVGYKTKEFPAFYSRESGVKLDYSLESPQQLAELFHYHHYTSPQSGILVANPIPEDSQIPSSQIMPIIEAAVKEAQQKGIKGKEVTPFLLAKLVELTEGKSLKANLSLVKNNVKLATEIALAYHSLPG